MKKILIIESNKRERAFLKKMFLRENYLCCEAPTAEMGLRLFKKARPDLVTLDISMRGAVTGDNFLRNMRDIAKPDFVPVIVITGNRDMFTWDIAYKYRIAAFFGKPFEYKDLLQRVNDTIRWKDVVKKFK
ncbi:MAG: response regulator [Elusimicrobia bacterium]|jgi:putative two-component system response regulator|nr:response regulator [Elusimicrobiota bacterium]